MSDPLDTEFGKLAATLRRLLEGAVTSPTTSVLVLRCGPDVAVMGNGDKDEGARLMRTALGHMALAAPNGPPS